MKWNVFFKRRLTAMTCRAYKALVRLTAVAAVVLTAAGCSGRYNYPRELLTADSLAEVDADSAVAFLRQMEPRMCHEPEPVHRYYQLLTIKAADKAYIPHTSDSLILTLVDYYENGLPTVLLKLSALQGADFSRTRQEKVGQPVNGMNS